MSAADDELPAKLVSHHRFLDEAGDTTFYGKARVPIIGHPGVSLSFAIGMVKFGDDLGAVRDAIREMQRAVGAVASISTPRMTRPKSGSASSSSSALSTAPAK